MRYHYTQSGNKQPQINFWVIFPPAFYVVHTGSESLFTYKTNLA